MLAEISMLRSEAAAGTEEAEEEAERAAREVAAKSTTRNTIAFPDRNIAFVA